MIERVRGIPQYELAKDTPEERRQYVLSIHAIAVRDVINRGKLPEEKEIYTFVERARENPYFWNRTLSRAAKLRAAELNRLFIECSRQLGGVREGQKMAERIIRDRYRAIDADPSQNCSFLDNLIFSSNGKN